MSAIRGSLMSAIAGAGVTGLAVWGWLAYQPAPAAPIQTTQPANPVGTENGLTVVTLDLPTQKLGDLGLAKLSLVKRQPEKLAYGTVVDLQPMIDLFARYRTASADLVAAKAAVTASNQESDRNLTLYKDGRRVSLKTAQSAAATASADKAKLQSAEANIQALQASALQQFGPVLAPLFPVGDGELARLLDRRDVLLRIAMPLGTAFAAPQEITIDDGTQSRIAANLVSPSPQSDPTIEGPVFLYRASAALPVGSKIVAHVPTSTTLLSGVIIPANAVIWFGGQPWAYVLEGENRFIRTPVPSRMPVDAGFFASTGFKPGDRVVTRGAQLLLSEEMRPPPTSVAACKDPECDD